MDPEIKKALDDLAKQWGEFRTANDDRIKAIESHQGHAELDAKLALIDKDITDTKAQLARMALGRNLGPQQGEPSAISREVIAWMRDPQRQGVFKSQVSTTTNADGGYFAVPEIDQQVDRIAQQTVALRRLANVKTISGPSFVKNVNKGGITATWGQEGDTRSGNSGGPQIAQIEIFPRELYTLPSATQESLEDLGFDVQGWLAQEAGIAFSETEDNAFLLGDGFKKPKGILASTMVTNSSYDWEKIGYIASGAAGAFATANPADKIIDLIHALKSKYRNGASFLLNDLTLAGVRKLKDGQGNYLWQPTMQLGMPDKLAGYPCEVSDNMPDIAADSYSIIFGNLNQGYQIIDRVGIKILADPYTTKGSVTFYVHKRTGGEVVNFEAIKVMKFAAS